MPSFGVGNIVRVSLFPFVTLAAMSGIADRRKLVLHLDVNNTVLIGDSITKQRTLPEALNEYLVDVVWGRLDENGDWKMDSETLSKKPPKAGLYSYYRFAENKYIGKSREMFKSHIRKFTEENSGEPFRWYYDKMLTALQFPGEFPEKSANLPTLNSGKKLYHRIVPSFYKLLHHLLGNGRNFAVAFRTFGDDGHLPFQATKEFLSPYTEVTMKASCKVDMSPGIITRSSYNQICLKLAENDTLASFSDVYTYFSQLHGVKLFVDDYSWWKSQGFNSKGGKPLLIDLSDPKVHHIMFDDNFRPWETTDSIVDVRLAKEGSFSSTDTGMFEDTCIVKADLFQSICNPNYFIDKIELCEQNYGRMFSESQT